MPDSTANTQMPQTMMSQTMMPQTMLPRTIMFQPDGPANPPRPSDLFKRLDRTIRAAATRTPIPMSIDLYLLQRYGERPSETADCDEVALLSLPFGTPDAIATRPADPAPDLHTPLPTFILLVLGATLLTILISAAFLMLAGMLPLRLP